jgi:hypothetical protein
LCDRFNRLYVLAENTSCSVAEMHHLGWDEGGDAWKWRRRLFAWEEDLLGNCCFLFHNVVSHDGVNDRWKWLLVVTKVSQSATFITCLQLQNRTLSGLLQLMFGSNTTLSKYLYLRGAFFATVFQQRITSLQGASFKQKQMSA